MSFIKASLFLTLFCFGSFAAKSQQLDSLLQILPHLKDDSIKLNTLDHITLLYFYVDRDKAKNYADTFLILSQKLRNEKKVGRAYCAIAQYFYFNKEWDSMKINLEKSNIIFTKLEEWDLLLPNKDIYAKYYRDIGEIEKALALHLEVLKYYEDTQNRVGEAKAMVSIALLMVKAGRKDEAENYYLKAAQIREDMLDMSGASLVYISLGALYSENNQQDKALAYLKKALSIQKGLGNKNIIADCAANLGKIYNSKKEYNRALTYINEAFSTYQLQANNAMVLLMHIYRSFSYNGLKKYKESLNELDEALKLMHREKVLSGMLVDIYYQYYQTYKSKGDFKKALEYYELHYQLDSEKMNLDMQQNISQLQEKYQSEKKEREIFQLQNENTINESKLKARTYFAITITLLLATLMVGSILIWRQNLLKQQRKSAILKHQVLRTQMNPHFIFNALNSIQRIYIEGDTDKANDFIADFAQLMRKILENSGKSQITLQEELETLSLYLELEKLRCKNCFSYEIKVDDQILTHIAHIPPLIIQPFVENAIWHGILPLRGKTKGLIVIEIMKTNDQKLSITIFDNGVGFVNKNHHRQQTSKGIEITKQRIGSELSIISILKGTSEQHGTRIQFTLKIT